MFSHEMLIVLDNNVKKKIFNLMTRVSPKNITYICNYSIKKTSKTDICYI